MENKRITVAVLTYNTLFPYERGVQSVEDTSVLFLPESFNPKCPKNVTPNDTNWRTLMEHKDTLLSVIIFAGKVASGALKIIKLACTSFADKKECLYFVLCHHEIQKKKDLLKRYGIKRNQYVSFEDGNLPCKEGPLLKGYMLECVQSLNRGTGS